MVIAATQQRKPPSLTLPREVMAQYAEAMLDDEVRAAAVFFATVQELPPQYVRSIAAPNRVKYLFPNYHRVIAQFVEQYDNTEDNVLTFLYGLSAGSEEQQALYGRLMEGRGDEEPLFYLFFQHDVGGEARRTFARHWAAYREKAGNILWQVSAAVLREQGNEKYPNLRAQVEAVDREVFKPVFVQHPKKVRDMLLELIARIDADTGTEDALRPDIIIPTGLSVIDGLFRNGGLENHQLYLVQAQTGVGKTAFLLKLLLQALKHTHSPVVVVSLEQPAKELHTRVIQIEGRMSYGDVSAAMSQRAKQYTPQELRENPYRILPDGLQDFIAEMDSRVTWFTGSQGGTLREIFDEITTVSALYGSDEPLIVLVDYLQLITPTPVPEYGLEFINPDGHQAQGDITRAFMNFIRATGSLVVMAAQLNDDGKNYGSSLPEKDAAAVIRLWNVEEDKQARGVTVFKNRIGEATDRDKPVRVGFDGATMVFRDPPTLRAANRIIGSGLPPRPAPRYDDADVTADRVTQSGVPDFGADTSADDDDLMGNVFSGFADDGEDDMPWGVA